MATVTICSLLIYLYLVLFLRNIFPYAEYQYPLMQFAGNIFTGLPYAVRVLYGPLDSPKGIGFGEPFWVIYYNLLMQILVQRRSPYSTMP